jgi:hypothetical protein
MADSELERALSPLRDGPVPLSTAAELGDARERLLPRLRGEVRALPRVLQRARRRRLALKITGLLGASALPVVLVLLLRAPETSPLSEGALRIEPLGRSSLTWRDDGATPQTLDGPSRLPARGVLASGDASEVRVTTARGVRIELSRHTDVDLGALDAGSRQNTLRVLDGEVECRVPPLGPGERFAVTTRDAEVVVHGTVFRVRTNQPDALHGTCVSVTEGHVTVRHAQGTVALEPGQSFGCETLATSAPVADAAPPAKAEAVEPKAPRRVANRVERRTKDARPSGTLEQENQLLSGGLSAERAGDCTRATRLFGELLSRYPGTPLAPEARGGLERCKGR